MSTDPGCESRIKRSMPGLPSYYDECSLPSGHSGSHYDADKGQAWDDCDTEATDGV